MSRVSENQLTKLYYTIGEVADMFEVNTSLIRFWEKEFPAIQPKKNKRGNRVFTAKDIIRIDEIYTLVKEEGYTLEGAKKALRQPIHNLTETDKSSENSHDEVIRRLEALKKRLLDFKG